MAEVSKAGVADVLKAEVDGWSEQDRHGRSRWLRRARWLRRLRWRGWPRWVKLR